MIKGLRPYFEYWKATGYRLWKSEFDGFKYAPNNMHRPGLRCEILLDATTQSSAGRYVYGFILMVDHSDVVVQVGHTVWYDVEVGDVLHCKKYQICPEKSDQPKQLTLF